MTRVHTLVDAIVSKREHTDCDYGELAEPEDNPRLGRFLTGSRPTLLIKDWLRSKEFNHLMVRPTNSANLGVLLASTQTASDLKLE